MPVVQPRTCWGFSQRKGWSFEMDYSFFLMRVCTLWFLSICLPSFSLAAVKISLTDLSFASLQKKIPVDLSASLRNSAIVMPQDFVLMDRHIDKNQTEHIRMQQRYLGFPVMGGYAIFHRHIGKSLLTMNGSIYQQLYRDLGECPSEFVTKMAEKLAIYRQRFPADQILNQAIQPIIYVDVLHKAHWAYQIQFYVQPSDQIPSRPTVIVDAVSGKLLLQWNALNTLYQAVHGVGYGGNRRTGKYQYGKEFPSLDIRRDEQSGLCFLENDHIKVVDMQHRIRHPNSAMRFLCEESTPAQIYWTGYEGDGYDQANGGYSVSNDALYFGELVKRMYRTQYGVEVLQVGHHSLPMILRVHFSNYFANAFWDGVQMTFGDGDGMLHPLVGLSITAHEISHGFTQYHSGLVYKDQAGGINEAFSDMAAQAAMYYVDGKPQWQIGADVLKHHGVLRWFQHPSRDGVSIERAIDYQPGMDVHHSSGVYNRLYYLLATHSGWNPQRAFQVMVKANMDYWTPTTSFVEGACGILSATRDLGWSEDDVKDALDEVVIDYGSC